MRGHKFLVLVESSYFLEGGFSDDIAEKMCWTDDAFMTVITVAHEKWEDNMVTVAHNDDPELELLRDINGDLYNVADFWDKNEVIKRFEQTDG